MKASQFRIDGMDCAAEEALVRMRLEGVAAVRGLAFDLETRSVTVHHEGGVDAIERAIAGLALGGRLLASVKVAGDGADPVGAVTEGRRAAAQRRLLWTVLLINAGFFALELTTGLISRSMGLVADSLDMLADALIYGLSLVAVGGSALRKRRIARASGYAQLALALLGFVEVVRRVLGVERLPDIGTMIVVSLLALAANGVSLYLLQRSKSDEVHLRATMIFTSNDVIINLGVIAAALLVAWTDSSLPDLVIGGIVFALVSRGAMRILRLASQGS